MTSQGSPFARFRRALSTGNLVIVRAVAKELPPLGLEDALSVLLLMEQAHDEAYERAADRWLARFVLERPSVSLADLRAGADALTGRHRIDRRKALAELCERHGLPRAGQALVG